MCVADVLERLDDGVHDLARAERQDLAAEAEDPLDEAIDIAVLRLERGGAILVRRDLAVLVKQAVDEPGSARGNVERGLANRLVQRPRRAIAVRGGIEVDGAAEIALLAGVEAHVATDARDAKVADRVAVVVVPDEVPIGVGEVETVRIDRARLLLARADREVREDDRLLLRDGAFELGEARGDLGGVATTGEVERHTDCGRLLEHARAAQREVLQREAQRRGVGELAFEQEQARVERREFAIGEVQRRQEVVLARERVELFAGELVAIRLDRHAQRQQFGAIGVEATSKRLVRHVVVALDRVLGVARSNRPLLGHDVRHQRELANQLVGVMTQRSAPDRPCGFLAPMGGEHRQKARSLRGYSPGNRPKNPLFAGKSGW